MSTLVFPPIGTQRTPLVQDFTSPGTYSITPPIGARFLWLEMIGGGGAGSGSYPGSGGAYFSMLIKCSSLSGSNDLVVGSGGAFNQDGAATTFFGLTAGGGGKGLNVQVPGGVNYRTWNQLNGYVIVGEYAGGGSANSDSMFGGGGYNRLGGTLADTYGALKAGNGATTTTTPGEAPGGAGGLNGTGGDGAARFTWIF